MPLPHGHAGTPPLGGTRSYTRPRRALSGYSLHVHLHVGEKNPSTQSEGMSHQMRDASPRSSRRRQDQGCEFGRRASRPRLSATTTTTMREGGAELVGRDLLLRSMLRSPCLLPPLGGMALARAYPDPPSSPSRPFSDSLRFLPRWYSACTPSHSSCQSCRPSLGESWLLVRDNTQDGGPGSPTNVRVECSLRLSG